MLFDTLNQVNRLQTGGSIRRKAERAVCLSLMKEIISYTKCFEQKPTLLLGYDAYVA